MNRFSALACSLDLFSKAGYLALVVMAALIFMSQAASAQSFFASLVADPTVGADRGSASQIRKQDEPATFLTFSNTGSDAAGRTVLGFGAAMPNSFVSDDQLDITAVWAGPSEDGWRELLAGGLSYRFPAVSEKSIAFVAVGYGDVILGTQEALAFEFRGDRLQVSAGVVTEYDLPDAARFRTGFEIIARRVAAQALGSMVIDEELRMFRASALYSQGIPNFAQRRFAISATKGIDGLGSSSSGNPLGSNPGAATDFLRLSIAAEASVPFASRWVTNVGIIGQWSDNSLPESQKCGFETNAYARGFDYAVVVGDRCFGARVELGYILQSPDLENRSLDATQLFTGIDAGDLRNLGNPVLGSESDTWSSLSVGVRSLQGNYLGEIAATRILDRPDVANSQDSDRVWVRLAYRF